MSRGADYLALVDQVREMRELSQQFRAHREAFDLTDEQLRARAHFEAAMRAGKLRSKPSCFATLPGEL